MMRVRELRSWASKMQREEFARQLGPFTLVQRPPDPVLAQVAMQLNASRTVAMSTRNRLVDEILAMVQGFDGLVVFPIPNLGAEEELTIGRTPECSLVLDEPSVSKSHAVLRWDTVQAGCSIADLGSSNGTFVNARELGEAEEHLLYDGDVVSFGDAQFMYFDTLSLYDQLRLAAARRGGT